MEIEASCLGDRIRVEVDRPSMYNQTDVVDGDVKDIGDGELVQDEEADLCPHPLSKNIMIIHYYYLQLGYQK